MSKSSCRPNREEKLVVTADVVDYATLRRGKKTIARGPLFLCDEPPTNSDRKCRFLLRFQRSESRPSNAFKCHPSGCMVAKSTDSSGARDRFRHLGCLRAMFHHHLWKCQPWLCRPCTTAGPGRDGDRKRRHQGDGTSRDCLRRWCDRSRYLCHSNGIEQLRIRRLRNGDRRQQLPVAGGNATATGAFSAANGQFATATGSSSIANGDRATATGYNSIANGPTGKRLRRQQCGQWRSKPRRSVKRASQMARALTALGATSQAQGTGAVAIGQNTAATSTNTIAIGNGAEAGFANSSAFGAGATTSAANQMSFGTTSNTYRMSGIASAASLAAQSGPTSFVTSDAAGNLAVAGFGPQDIATLQSKRRKLAGANETGVPKVRRLPSPWVAAPCPLTRSSRSLRISGNFRGESALSLGAQMRLTEYAVAANFGIASGLQQHGTGTRAGLTFAW